MRELIVLSTVFAAATMVIAGPVITSFQGNGVLSVTNVIPGRRYSVQWKSSLATGEWRNTWQDLHEIEAVTNQMVFTVPMFFRVLEDVDITPPANISGLAVNPTDQMVFLSWTNPSDADFAGVLIVRNETGTPNSLYDGTVVYDGLEASFADISVENGKPYFYRVFAYDSAFNYANGVVASAIPQASLTTITVTETFSDSNGQNNLVDTRNTTAYYDPTNERYFAAKPGVENSTQVALSSAPSDQLIKSFDLSGYVAWVSNEITYGTAGTSVSCYVKFLFSDGTSHQTPSQTGNNVFAPKTYFNPYFNTRLVTKIQVFIRGGSYVYERNTASSPIYSAPVVVEFFNPHSGGNIIQTWLDIASVRETYDIISYELTDGITTNRYNKFATWYPVTNALTNPTKIRLLLNPATVNLTEGGTGLISIDFKMRKR